MIDFDKFVKDNISNLQEKGITNITKHKINYISDYVYNWSIIGANYSDCKQINFIDCMCNAGIYKDSTLTTSMRVLQTFIKHAKKYPNKIFNLFLNDYNKNRVDLIIQLAKAINYEQPKNINIMVDNMDVNNYLDSFNFKYANSYLGYGAFTILFVDPYNFGTVKIKKIKEFSENNYSEIIFNYFSSDYLRNMNNSFAISKIESIKSSMEGVNGYNEQMTEMQVLDLIQAYFKTSKIKYSFAYQFRTRKNVPLYNIVYATPNIRGLEEIKDTFWRVFDGNPFFLNYEEQEKNLESTQQFQLFNNKDLNELSYSKEAQKRLINNYYSMTISYDDIDIYILENTMLRKGQVIKTVIKPLICDGKIVKLNKKSIKDYTHDLYSVIGDKDD